MVLRETVQRLRSRVSLPWLTLVVLFVAVIWGNSLVPGEGSGSLSLTVMELAHSALRAFGLPYEWVTNFVVRKTAHFSEYLVLGVLASQAFDPKRTIARGTLPFTFAFCALVPSIDEAIQLFVPGRSGMVADVLLDCCGAATGILLRTAVVRLANRKRVKIS